MKIRPTRHFHRRAVVVTVLVVAAIAALAATASSALGGASTKHQSKVTLSIVWFNESNESNYLAKIEKDYQKTHPNVSFKLILVPYTQLATKVKTMIAGGAPPALVLETTPGDLAGSLVNLSQYMPTKKFLAQFIPSVRGYAMVDGQPEAAPFNVTANGLLYNKALFAKAGVSVPTSPGNVWSWSQFESAVQQVMAKGGARIGIAMDNTYFRFSTLIYQAGGRILSADGKKMLINSPQATSAYAYLLKLANDGVLDKSTWLSAQPAIDLFQTGQAAVLFSGDWQLPVLTGHTSFPWAATYLPKGPSGVRSTVPGGKQLLVIKGSGVEKQAFNFLEFFISKRENAYYCTQLNELSAIAGNSDLKYTKNLANEKIFENELAVSPTAPGVDWAYLDNVIPGLYTPMGNDVVSMLQGNMTPQQATNDIATQGEALIAKEK